MFFERRLDGGAAGQIPASGASGHASVDGEPQESPGVEKPRQRDRRDLAEEEFGQGRAHSEKDGRSEDGEERLELHDGGFLLSSREL
jgi:hypothetical protein